MREQVLNLLKEKSYSFLELQQKLGCNKLELYQTLKRLIQNYHILETKNHQYVLMEGDYRIGRIHKGSHDMIFVKVHDGVVRMSKDFLKNLSHGDLVKIKLITTSPKVGQIEEVLSKMSELLTGTVYNNDGNKLIKIDGNKHRNLILHVKDDTIPVDYKVLFKLGKPIYNHHFDVDILKVLGPKEKENIEMISMLERRSIPYVFPNEVLEEVSKIPISLRKEDVIGRKDYRNQFVFSIDDEDTEDRDDALSIYKNEYGNYVLCVHIADVSHYVKEGSFLFEEALKRGTSVYLSDLVIPMLPEELSTGICSLIEGKDRLTISTEIEITPKADIVSYRFYESVVCLKKNMSYKDVNKCLKGEIVSGYEPFMESLYLLRDLTLASQKRNQELGRINFDQEESYVVMRDGKVEDIVLRVRDLAEEMVEEAMIFDNKVMATHLQNLSLPGAYRGHRAPRPEALKKVDDMLNNLGISLGFSLQEKGTDPRVIAEVLEKLKPSPYYNVISHYILRSMRKAEYTSVPTEHFGLGITGMYRYTHFTSPIRRWNDLITHRIFKDLVFGKNNSYKRIMELEELLPFWASRASFTERRAIDFERDIDKLRKCEYLRNHIGEVYHGNLLEIHEQHLTIDINGLFYIYVPTHILSNFIMDPSKVSYQDQDGIHFLGEEVSVKITEILQENGFVYGTLVKEKILRKEYDHGNR